MPKLAAKDRKKVEKAEATTGEFKPMAPGKYVATLKSVEAKISGNGNPYWNAEFEEIHDLDGEKQPGRQWYMLMLPTSDTPPDDYREGESDRLDKWGKYQALCAGRLKAFFEAYGFTVDSDTDEMIGERAVLQVGIETIQKGAKAGQATNRVNAVLPLDSVDFDDSFSDGKKGDDGEF